MGDSCLVICRIDELTLREFNLYLVQFEAEVQIPFGSAYI